MGMKAVNLEECYGKFDDVFSPKIVGELNGQLVMVVHLEGDKVPWHIHDDEDEMFFVVDGNLEVFERNNGSIVLGPGEFYIVKSGIEHRVLPHNHVKLILFEPATIKHTGSVKAEITKTEYERLI